MVSHDRETAMETLGTPKGRVGKFHYYQAGKMNYVVRYGDGGPVVAAEDNLSQVCEKAVWFYNLEKRGEYFAEILADSIAAYS